MQRGAFLERHWVLFRTRSRLFGLLLDFLVDARQFLRIVIDVADQVLVYLNFDAQWVVDSDRGFLGLEKVVLLVALEI